MREQSLTRAEHPRVLRLGCNLPSAGSSGLDYCAKNTIVLAVVRVSSRVPGADDDDDTIAGKALQPFTAAGRVLGTTDYHDRVCSGSFATPETADDVGGATGDDEAVSEE